MAKTEKKKTEKKAGITSMKFDLPHRIARAFKLRAVKTGAAPRDVLTALAEEHLKTELAEVDKAQK